MDPKGRYKAYHADVTYVTNHEIGFGETFQQGVLIAIKIAQEVHGGVGQLQKEQCIPGNTKSSTPCLAT